MSDSFATTRVLEILIAAHNQNRAVAVYADAEEFQAYEVGFVEYVDCRQLVLRCLTPRGEADGRRIIKPEHIIRADTETSYLLKMELLYQHRDEINLREFQPISEDHMDFHGQLVEAQKSNTLVHIVDANDCGPTGFISNIGIDYVEMMRVNSLGQHDGYAMILLSGICKIHIGRRQEQVLEFLYNYNRELTHLLES